MFIESHSTEIIILLNLELFVIPNTQCRYLPVLREPSTTPPYRCNWG